METLLYLASWLIRFAGSYLDGRVGRGDLSWWHFHLLNWSRRDLPIVLILIPVFEFEWHLWIGHAIAHYIVHVLFYKVSSLHRRRYLESIQKELFSHV